MKFRPNMVVDAIQIKESNKDEIKKFVEDHNCAIRSRVEKGKLKIALASSDREVVFHDDVEYGDYLVREYGECFDDGLFTYICVVDKEIFEIQYSPVCNCGGDCK